MEKLTRYVRDLRNLCENFVNFKDLYDGGEPATVEQSRHRQADAHRHGQHVQPALEGPHRADQFVQDAADDGGMFEPVP